MKKKVSEYLKNIPEHPPILTLYIFCCFYIGYLRVNDALEK